MCLSVKSHLTYGASVRPEIDVTYSAGKEGGKICGVFSETAPLQRSGTSCIVCLCAVGHFPAESAHAHCSIYHVVDRSGHFFLCGGVRRRRLSFVSFCLFVCLFVDDYSRTTGYEAAYERYQQLQCYKGLKNNVAILLKRLRSRDMA